MILLSVLLIIQKLSPFYWKHSAGEELEDGAEGHGHASRRSGRRAGRRNRRVRFGRRLVPDRPFRRQCRRVAGSPGELRLERASRGRPEEAGTASGGGAFWRVLHQRRPGAEPGDPGMGAQARSEGVRPGAHPRRHRGAVPQGEELNEASRSTSAERP